MSRRTVRCSAPSRSPTAAWAFAGRFGVIEAPAKLDALVGVLADWRPDLVVHDSADLAAPIAAAAAGVPSAHHAFGRSIPVASLAAAAAETASLWAGVGLEPEPLCGLYRGTYVDLCPPSFQGDGVPAGTPVEPIRPLFPPARDETPPAWLQTLPDRPLVYVTLGTVFNEPGLFGTLLESLRDVECTAILTVGRDNDPADLGPLPANVLVEPYVAQWFVSRAHRSSWPTAARGRSSRPSLPGSRRCSFPRAPTSSRMPTAAWSSARGCGSCRTR